jgi:hypothetical protein
VTPWDEDDEDIRNALSDLASLLIGLQPGLPVDRTEVGGLTVSTLHTADVGYETAVCDRSHAYPVERYDSLEAAQAGHRRWVERAPGLTSVMRLGYGHNVPPEVFELERR